MFIDEWFCILKEKYGNDFNWMSTSSDSFVDELKLELGDGCNMDSISVIAKCESNDDVLFFVDGIYRIYHLTYSGKLELLSFLEFNTISEVINYIEKDYIENYM